jgi:MoaA/NifB/PqqE/SkfB family radical SAM enzyme
MRFEDYEISRHIEYRHWINKGISYSLCTYPYLDIVFQDHCNSKCSFCVAQLIHDKIWFDIEVFKEKIHYAITILGVKEVLILGGEPTINDEIFEILEFLRKYNLNKICITTNGRRITQDLKYIEILVKSGITHVNLSLMSLNLDKQSVLAGVRSEITLEKLKDVYDILKQNNIHLRINNNVFKGNNDSVLDIITFYNAVSSCCDSVKFSPLLKTDSFSTVNSVTTFNCEHTLSDQKYEELWNTVEACYSEFPIVRNRLTLGFVEYSMIFLPVPLIFNYNHRGKLKQMVVEEKKIHSFKLLPTGDLSISWNREESKWFIDTKEAT